MADNFQLSSEVLPALTSDERRWVERVLTDVPDAKSLQDAGINVRAVDFEDWPGFQWDMDPGRGALRLYSWEYGNAGELVRALLARFRPDDCWHLTWAETCSKPRIGEFGGGGLFVTARSVRAFSAVDWVVRQRKGFESRLPRRK